MSEQPCVIYAAKSTKDKHLSIPEQLDDCREMADENDWTIVGELVDENFTAYTGNRGPGLAAAIALAKQTAAERGQCFIVAQHTSRFARGDGASPNAPRALVELWHEWARANVRGRLVENDSAMASSAQAANQGEADHNESKRKSKSVRKGLRRRAERGEFKGGPRPYGFALGEVVQLEADVIRRMFADSVDGVSQRALAAALTSEGIPTVKGREWRQTTIRRMLANPMYRGTIVDEDVFDRVQAARSGSSKRGGRPPLGTHILTRGTLRCGRCGSAMIPHVSTPNDPAWARCESYVCSRRSNLGVEFCSQPRVRRSVVDSAFLEELNRRYLDHDETVRRVEARRATDLSRAMEMVAQAERELLGVNADARLSKIKRGWQEDVLTDDEYRSQRAEVEDELAAAEGALQRASAHVESVEAAGGLSDVETAVLERMGQIRAMVVDGVGRAPDLPALRNLIRRLFESVELIEWPGYGVHGKNSHDGWAAPGENPTVEDRGRTLALIPHVRWEAVDLGADEMIRKAALTLADDAATEERTPRPWSPSRPCWSTTAACPTTSTR